MIPGFFMYISHQELPPFPELGPESLTLYTS